MEFHPQKQFNLNDYLRIFYRGQWIVVICVVVVIVYTVLYNISAPLVYEASSLIMLKKEGGVQKALFNDADFGQPETQLHNHMEILKSRSLAKEVIHRLQQMPQADSLIVLGNPPKIERFSIKRWFLSSILGRQEKPPDKPSFDRLVEKFPEKLFDGGP